MPVSPISPFTGCGSTTCISTAASAGPRPLTVAEVLVPREGEAALAEAEERLLAEANALGAPLLARLAGHKAAAAPGRWRAIGLDAEGLDLAAGGRAARAQFAAPAHDPEAWRAHLEAAARGRLARRTRRSVAA